MFDLPEYLTLCTGALLLNMSRRNGNHWRSLIEILKFVNDYAGFAGPILLNGVVSFMEDPDPDSGMVTGYIYAILLAISSFIGALFSFYFNLFMTELGVKVRAALTTAVYDNTVTVSKSSLSQFSCLQILTESTNWDQVYMLP